MMRVSLLSKPVACAVESKRVLSVWVVSVLVAEDMFKDVFEDGIVGVTGALDIVGLGRREATEPSQKLNTATLSSTRALIRIFFIVLSLPDSCGEAVRKFQK